MPFLFDWTTFSGPSGSTTITDGANSTTFSSSAISSASANDPLYYSNFGGTVFAQGVAAGQESGLDMSFSTAVDNLSFTIVDLDQGPSWDDQVQILAYDAQGNLLTPIFTIDPTVHTLVNATTVEATGNHSPSVDGPTAPDSVYVTFTSPVKTIQIIMSGSDSSGVRSGAIGISDFAGDVVCFAQDTLIETRRGPVPVQDLAPDDLVVTLDRGLQPIRWVGSRRVAAAGKFAPIHIADGALGNSGELVLSPQHRVLVTGWQAELLFGEPEVLVAAKHLINDNTIARKEGGYVVYYHILFDRHEVVFAQGTPCESFHPGHVGMGAIGEEQRAEIFALFPELETDIARFGPVARPSVKAAEGTVLASAMI